MTACTISFDAGLYARSMGKSKYYTAMLLGTERVGTGEPVRMQMPESGEPPQELRRPLSEDSDADVQVYQRWGDSDGDIYTYTLIGVFPARP